MELRKICSIALLSAVTTSVMAVPASREGILRTDAEGTEKMVFLNGDEFFHYVTDANGNWLDEETLLPMTEEQKTTRKQVQNGRAKARRIQHETGLDRTIAPRGAVILVSFADLAFLGTHEDMVDWAMGDNNTYNGATGSIRQYFLDQSWGQYEMQIDIIGPVTVSKGYAYYGKNDVRTGDDMHADEMVKEACILAHDSLGVDFSRYDNNGNGNVDWVVIIYAGYGEASGAPENTIWPHQYELSYTDMDFKLDGKTIDHYCCLNELNGTKGKTRCGIGTFCHEFCHVMGLPDFYATNSARHRTLADWDIMDYGPYNNGGNTPPNFSAYERWFMGWFKPRLVNSAASVILPSLHEYHSACFMTEQGDDIDNILHPNPKTFYLFENRQQKGWDKFLPGAGLMITKVQWSSTKWSENTVNNTAINMGVDMIEATPNSSDLGDETDLYPAGADAFSKIAAYQVTNIAMADEVVTFDVNGGGPQIHLDVTNVAVDKAAQKIIREGRVLIVRNGVTYDLNGRMIE
ncbi:MAG: M6 family metalloprotease domain-containing protein [Paludibacteraceae bacterium]|nr:M6 family metalloprotease domain-containing protein [Paludibacteraceae bacterium]